MGQGRRRIEPAAPLVLALLRMPGRLYHYVMTGTVVGRFKRKQLSALVPKRPVAKTG
ncbi:MAG: hypothetical protein M3M97_06090 [Actinomycetota bacterium]|jgi:hypothetical protein|nr:hypothetical protein [Actinomycetota bacterium]